MRHTLLLLALCLTLTSCGIKPSSVEPPEGASDAVFPATYPKVEDDIEGEH